jgi:hypothetical protein
MVLCYDLQIDMEYEDSQALGCDVRFFSSLGVSGEFEGKRLTFTSKGLSVSERLATSLSELPKILYGWTSTLMNTH